MATGTVVTNAGLVELAKLACGGTADAFTYVALGTGGTTPAATDTALESEITTNGGERVVADTHAYEADYKAKFVEEFTFSGSLAILECGILNAASSGDPLMRHVFASTINVVSTDTLTLTITVTFSDTTA